MPIAPMTHDQIQSEINTLAEHIKALAERAGGGNANIQTQWRTQRFAAGKNLTTFEITASFDAVVHPKVRSGKRGGE